MPPTGDLSITTLTPEPEPEPEWPAASVLKTEVRRSALWAKKQNLRKSGFGVKEISFYRTKKSKM